MQYKFFLTNNSFCFGSYGVLLALLALTACTGNKTAAVVQNPLFVVTGANKTNITFQNTLQDSDKLNILNYLYFYNGAGVAAGDVNRDGLTDLFFVANQGDNQLYLNKGNFQFQDISQKSRHHWLL